MMQTAGCETVQSQGRGVAGLSREQLLDRIMDVNPTASPEFLGRFDDAALCVYLERLSWARQPRGPQARWVHRSETPAVLAHEPRD